MKTITKILVFFALLVCGSKLNAQVTVILQQPPAFQFRIENMWKVTLVNSSQNSMKVYLKGLATARTDGQIVEVTTSSFNLPQGMKIVSARELAPLKVDKRNPRYTDAVEKVGSVPSGDYDICVSAYNTETNILVGEMCVQSQVLNLTQVELIQPENGTVFDSDPSSANVPQNQLTEDEKFAVRLNQIGRPKPRNSNTANKSNTGTLKRESTDEEQIDNAPTVPLVGGLIPFSWMPPAPVPQGVRVTYSLSITEIVGRQSPYDAIRSNPKAVYLENIQTNMAILPMAARRLLHNRSYAWKVDVFLDGKIFQESTVYFFKDKKKDKCRNCDTCLTCGVNDPPEDFTSNSTERKEIAHEVSQNSSSNANYSVNYPMPVYSNRNDINTMNSMQMNARGFSPMYAGRNLFSSIISGLQSLTDGSTSDSSSSGESPIQLIGDSRIEYHNASRVGTYSEVPKNYLTANLNPGIKFYGLPFSTNILYSTQQDTSRQSINQFGVNFDFNSMREGLANRLQKEVEKKIESAGSLSEGELSEIRNPNNLMDNLEKYTPVSGAEKFFMSIRTLGVGTNYPSYSDYILNGVPVTGFNTEINPGIFYTAFTASNNQRALDNAAYQRNLYAGRLGLGTKDASHFLLTGLYVSDDASSIRLDSTNQTLAPRENSVLGVDGKISMFNDHLTLETEGAVSMLTRDTRDAEFTNDAIPSFLKSIITPRISSSADFMYTGKLSYRNDESATNISAGVKMIGPGYSSLGVPLLRNDQFIYEAKFNQRLFDQHVSIGSSFRNAHDNLISWKSSRTTMTSIGVNLGFNFPKLPFLQLSFSPTVQKNDDTDSLRKIENNLTIFSAITGYTFAIGTTNASTTLSVNGQKTKTINGLGDLTTNSYMIGEMLNFRLPLSVGVNFGIIEMQSPTSSNRTIQNIELNSSAPIGESINVGIGVNYANEKNQNERIGFSANSSFQLSKAFSLDARIEKTTFNEFIATSGSYGELLMTVGLRTHW